MALKGENPLQKKEQDDGQRDHQIPQHLRKCIRCLTEHEQIQCQNSNDYQHNQPLAGCLLKVILKLLKERPNRVSFFFSCPLQLHIVHGSQRRTGCKNRKAQK